MEVDGFENSSPRKSVDIVYPQPGKVGWEDDLTAGPEDVDMPFHDLVPQSDHHSLASDDDPVVRSKSVELTVPDYLTPYAVAPVQWHPKQKVQKPLLLRGELREYQQHGLEWLANLHTTNQNGILADEMGLGKTIQTIALLAHLACDRGIWGPHLIIVPTSVILNWEMEFKKFLPGFRVLAYHGNTTKRRELRKGWNDKYSFNVCITSYALATRDVSIFKRRSWYYMILDEAHMIKNFKSQRWNLLLLFKSFRRLLLTGTPLQNNLTELWALLQFLKAGSEFASQKEFGDWFSSMYFNLLGLQSDADYTQKRVEKLRKILRSVMLRRLKSQVEKQLPKKHEHDVLCPLSKRQRFLYDEFMSRAQTQAELQSGVYQKIANILMQLRKVCNHPDLFEVRPIVTSFAMSRSAIADYEIKELLRNAPLAGHSDSISSLPPTFDSPLHCAAVKLQIAFPDPFLLQFDCGKLQYLADLLREKKAGGHRVLIFTQMTRILDILEVFLNFHGYLYLRLDGATKIEDRQYVTERFNADERVFCFIASSRSGGVGINLTGADTVVFYDSDFNPQMDRQCEDRSHRIGQIRDVHIYRFVSQHTVEEAMLRKANQKRSLDNLVIQRGEYDWRPREEYDWRRLGPRGNDWRRLLDNEQAVTAALAEVEDQDDAHAAAVAMREANAMDDADQADFEDERAGRGEGTGQAVTHGEERDEGRGGEEGEGGSISDYMISLVMQDYEHFAEWRA
ncbi:SNF2 family N-terminal domain-containing protein [Schizophyllum commune]